MGTDRYSDNHQIIIGGGDGELEITAGTFLVNSDSLSFNVDNMSFAGNDINLIADDDLTIYAGLSGGSNGNIYISANNGDPPQIKLDQNKRNVIITSENWAPLSSLTDCVFINADRVSVLGGSFVVSDITDVSISPDEGASISPGENLNITTPEFNINVDTLNFRVDGNIDFDVTGNIDSQNNINLIVPSNITISGSNDATDSYILTVENTAADNQADILKLSIPNVNIDWSDDGTVSLPNDLSIGSGNNFIGFWTDGIKIAEIEGVWNQNDSELQQTGGSGSNYSGVRFINGNPSDFAEWLEISQVEEWGFSLELLEKIKSFKKKILPIQEGTVVYVRDKKVHKSSPGTPMIVSHRAAFVGNSSRIHKDFGIIVSFCGQVPVLTSGPANDGDYLLAVDGENYCVAISKNDITFNDYKKVIGTCWESNQSVELKKVNCAIGIK